jgi:nitroreductase
MDLLWPLNQQWAQTAGALVIVLSNKWWLYKGEKQLIPTHSYDTGAAWVSMALEGTARGLVVHGMGGFDYDKAYQLLGVTKDTHNIDAMIAIGKRPAKEDRKQQEAISQRNPIDKFVFEGVFVNNDKI